MNGVHGTFLLFEQHNNCLPNALHICSKSAAKFVAPSCRNCSQNCSRNYSWNCSQNCSRNCSRGCKRGCLSNIVRTLKVRRTFVREFRALKVRRASLGKSMRTPKASIVCGICRLQTILWDEANWAETCAHTVRVYTKCQVECIHSKQ